MKREPSETFAPAVPGLALGLLAISFAAGTVACKSRKHNENSGAAAIAGDCVIGEKLVVQSTTPLLREEDPSRKIKELTRGQTAICKGNKGAHALVEHASERGLIAKSAVSRVGGAPPAVIPSPAMRGDSTEAFDVNDVSFLWPLVKSPADKSHLLPLDAGGAKGELLPRSTFDRIIEASRGEAIALTGDGELNGFKKYASVYGDYALWRVVAYRFDPCAPRVDLPACGAELRLVAQPVVDAVGDFALAFGANKAGALDYALNLVYDFPSTEVERAAEELAGLKKTSRSVGASTSGVALGVHPALAKQGPQGAFAQALKKHILANVGADTLKRATFSGSSAGFTRAEATRLVFVETRGSGGNLALGDLPLMRGSEASPLVFAQMFDTAALGEDPFVPEPPGARTVDGHTLPPRPERNALGPIKNPHSLSLFFTPGFRASAESSALREEAEIRRLLVANPLAHTQQTTDCVSCHMVNHPAAAKGKPGAAQAVERFKAPGKVTGQLNEALLPKSVSVLRAFGHTELEPVVNERVVNESAAVAGYLNRKFPLLK